MVLAKEIEATYEVLSKMGEGGMGAVYKVRHRFFDEIRVIKVMQAEIEAVDELKERFLGEAKRGKQLRHPNLAEVIDFSVAADGTSYMVMEYIEGVNLRELMTRNNGPLDYTVLVPIAEQALAALAYLHSKHFVHRDISPDNIMLTSEGEPPETRVKLIDLGIAKSLEATKSLTMAGKFIGKVQYASPEQFSGRVDGRSDLYSFGVVLYELLTGAKPITGKDYFAILGGHLSKPPRSFGETDPDNRVPAVIREAVLKALAKRPEDRFQSAGEFAEALRSTLAPSELRTVEMPIATTLPGEIGAQPAVTEVSEAVTMQTAPAAPSQAVARSLPRWYPIAAVIALVLIAGITALWFQSKKTTTASREPPLTLTLSPPLRGEGTVVGHATAPGQLLINAFPWGQVTSVTNAAGEEQLKTGAADTPLMLTLQPGSYKVRLTNPNSNRSMVLDVAVTSATVTRAETELDTIDAATYVEGIGIGQ
jgi:tRNA A-37 threonylcarbamoyl transferase component Bud32